VLLTLSLYTDTVYSNLDVGLPFSNAPPDTEVEGVFYSD